MFLNEELQARNVPLVCVVPQQHRFANLGWLGRRFGEEGGGGVRT